jgi:hypothetical protein
MKVKTTVGVSKRGFYDEIAELEMLSIQPLEDGSVRISAHYMKKDGTIMPPSVNKTYSVEKVDAIYAGIASGVTKKQPAKFMWECMSKAMIVVVAEEFGIEANQVVSVND